MILNILSLCTWGKKNIYQKHWQIEIIVFHWFCFVQNNITIFIYYLSEFTSSFLPEQAGVLAVGTVRSGCTCHYTLVTQTTNQLQ